MLSWGLRSLQSIWTPSRYSLDEPSYSAADLQNMTISDIKALAAELGYSITKTKKADIIAEFLSAQEV